MVAQYAYAGAGVDSFVLAGLVHDFAALRDGSLANWIAAHAAFPSSMLDRIVPAATDEVPDAAVRATGLQNAASVLHELFRQ